MNGLSPTPLDTNHLDRDARNRLPVGLTPTQLFVEDHHMRHRVLLAVTFLALIAALHAGAASAQSLVASTLPTSRSVQVGNTATAFATIINTDRNNVALNVSIALQTNIPASFTYQTTDPQTNALTGSPNTPVNIPTNGGSQSFLIAITQTAPIAPTEAAVNSH